MCGCSCRQPRVRVPCVAASAHRAPRDGPDFGDRRAGRLTASFAHVADSAICTLKGVRRNRTAAVSPQRGSSGFPGKSRQRSFGFDVLACPRCGDRLDLIALIEDPTVIRRILSHLGLPTDVPTARPARPPPLPRGRPGPWYDADDVIAP
jgi:hypothetical protein